METTIPETPKENAREALLKMVDTFKESKAPLPVVLIVLLMIKTALDGANEIVREAASPDRWMSDDEVLDLAAVDDVIRSIEHLRETVWERAAPKPSASPLGGHLDV